MSVSALTAESIDWLIVRFNGRSVDWLIVRLINWSIDWLIDWSVDWLIDWLIGRLIDWLIDWLIQGDYDLRFRCVSVLNCVRLLTRLVPFFLEEPEWRSFFWSALAPSGKRYGPFNRFSTSSSVDEESSSTPTNKFADAPVLATTLMNALSVWSLVSRTLLGRKIRVDKKLRFFFQNVFFADSFILSRIHRDTAQKSRGKKKKS